MKWKLQILTFVGVLAYAEHYMGYLQPPDKRENPNILGGEYGWPPDKIAVEYVLDAETAKRLSTDDFTYREGWECARFFSREDVIDRAKAQFLELAEPGDFLVSSYDDMVDDEPTELARKAELS